MTTVSRRQLANDLPGSADLSWPRGHQVDEPGDDPEVGGQSCPNEWPLQGTDAGEAMSC